MRVAARGWIMLAAAAAGPPSCVGTVGNDEVHHELRQPVRQGFEAVADAMQPSCGTLDCHGQIGRNLRLYGARGLRLDGADNSEEGTTMPAEHEATYWAIVALEPEAMSAAVAEGGRDPERLMLIRKGRGATRHKGGDLMRTNPSLDRCLVEWLKGIILVDECAAAELVAPTSPP